MPAASVASVVGSIAMAPGPSTAPVSRTGPTYVETDPRWMAPQDRSHLRFWAMMAHAAAAACMLLGAFNVLFAFLAVVVPGMILIGRWGDGRFLRHHALASLVLQALALVALLAVFASGIKEQVVGGGDPWTVGGRMQLQTNLVIAADLCIAATWAALAGTGRTVLGKRSDQA
jgi:hypothetical protein